MIGRLLCKLGLHRNEFKDVRRTDAGHDVVLTYWRCKRLTCRYHTARVVNVENVRKPKMPLFDSGDPTLGAQVSQEFGEGETLGDRAEFEGWVADIEAARKKREEREDS